MKKIIYICLLILIFLGYIVNNVFAEDLEYWEYSSETKTLTINNDLGFDNWKNSLTGENYYGKTEVEKVIISDDVTNIPTAFFRDYTQLKSVELGENSETIKMLAFERCTSLTNIVIPNSVTKIERGAFKDCSGLGSVTIGNNVNTIDPFAFERCVLLTNIVIPNSVTKIEQGAFKDCSGLGSATIGNNVNTIGPFAFERCTSLTNIVIPNSVTKIEQGAFKDCSGLGSTTIGNNVNTIGPFVFERCTSLTNIIIPNSVIKIEQGAFKDCSGLENVTIGNNVNTIGPFAFERCVLLTNIVIPSSVTKIEQGAFNNLQNIEDIVFKGDMPTISQSSFANLPENTKVHIIGECQEEYKKYFGNSDLIFTYKIVINNPDGAIIIPNGTIQILQGNNKEIEIKVKSGYELKSVKINDIEQKLPLINDKITISNIQKNITINVECGLIEETTMNKKNKEQKDNIPQTGDNIEIYISILGIALIGYISVNIRKGKKK